MSRKEVEQRHEVGLDCMMWGSDYPHPEGTWPQTEDTMREVFHGFPESDVAAIVGGNAAAFYGFDAEKLASLTGSIGPEKSRFQ